MNEVVKVLIALILVSVAFYVPVVVNGYDECERQPDSESEEEEYRTGHEVHVERVERIEQGEDGDVPSATPASTPSVPPTSPVPTPAGDNNGKKGAAVIGAIILGGAAVAAGVHAHRSRSKSDAKSPEPNQQTFSDITVANSNLQGGPADNQNTVFEGGDGPGRCGGMGLPNYWVNTATLNLVVQDTIFAYHGLGPSISLILTYNASHKYRGMFGGGWSFSYESMIEQVDETIYLWKGSGQRLSYQPGSPANRQSPNDPLEAVSIDGKFDQLHDYGQYWLFIEKNTRLKYRYDKLPGTNTNRLTTIADPNGNTVQIRYSADGTIQTITDAAGRLITFAYDDKKRCISFSIPDGRTATFSYDDQGNLVKAQDLLGIPSVYVYDTEQYITQMTVGHDHRTTTFTYPDSGRGKYIEAVTGADGNTTRYEMVLVDPRQVRVIDPEGRITTYHSTNGLTEQIVDPLGNTVVYCYTGDLRVSIQNRNRQTSRMEYDTRGNMTRHTDALGNTTTFVFGAFDNLVSETNPLGETWRYAYDDKHNLTHMTSPTGRVVAMEYDSQGQPVAIADANGNKRTLAYDRSGNLAAATDPLGNTIRFSHDPYGLTLTAITDARGNTTQYEYDNNNRLTKVTHPDGSTGHHIYDCCTEIATIDENGHKTTFSCNPIMMLKEWTDKRGNTMLFGYDQSNRLVNVVDALDRSLKLDYDDAGRRIQWTNFQGMTLQMKRDPIGNLIALTDERGMQTTLEHNANNLLTRITDPLGHSMIFTWDLQERLAAVVNSRGGRLARIYDADGRITCKSYDGVQFAAYEYDTATNLIKMTDASGTTTYKYNSANLVTTIRYSDGLEVFFSYDEACNINAITYPGGMVVRYTYDNRNRLAKIAWGKNSISYRYDAMGNLIGESRSNGTESTYAYNANNEFVENKHRKGADTFAHITYTRDAMGNITAESGNPPCEPVLTNISVVIAYNDVNQIVTRGSDRYMYDADGNLTEISGGKWRAVYDPENRLVELHRNGQTTFYSYNGLGQRVKAVTDSRCMNFHYDPVGRLLFETDESGQIVDYYIYSGGLLSAQVKAAEKTYFYHYDKTGNTLAMTDTDGKVIAAYAYSPFGAVVNKSGLAADNPFTYVGQFGVMDEGDGLFFMKQRYYDAVTGRFIQKDPIGFDGGVNLYAYVENNPVVGVDPEGTEGVLLCGALILIAFFGATWYFKSWFEGHIPPWNKALNLHKVTSPVERQERAVKIGKEGKPYMGGT